MKTNQVIKVYTDCIVGWEFGVLIEQYDIVEEGVLERWLIQTETGTKIVRYVKNSKELRKNGCGYVI